MIYTGDSIVALSAKKFDSIVRSNTRAFEVPLRDAERECASLNEQKLAIDLEITKTLTRLAQLRINSVETSGLTKEVETTLKYRAEEERAMRHRLSSTEADISKGIANVEAIENDIAEINQEIDAKLSASEAFAEVYQTRSKLAAEYNAFKEVSTQINLEYETKIPEYKDNPFYRYLQTQNYGQDAYHANLIVRLFDQWLANRIGFNDNQHNHKMLVAMRDAIKEQEAAFATTLKDIEEEIATGRRQLEKEARLPEVLTKLQRAKVILQDDKDQANEFHEGLIRYAEKADARYTKAVELLTKALKGQSIAELMEQARQTESNEDNVVVEQLQSLFEKQSKVRSQWGEQNEQRATLQSNYSKAKSLESSLLHTKYGSSSYEYSSGLDLDSLFAGYIAGTLTNNQIDRQISNHRRIVEEDYEPIRVTQRSSSSNSSSYSSYASSSSSDSDSGSFFSSNSSGDSGSSSFSTSDSF